MSLEHIDTCSDVRIATLQEDALQEAMYSLMGLLFFDTSDEPRFVSVTRVNGTITLVADAARLERVPKLDLDPTEWAVLRVDGVLSVVGAIASLTSPLADAKIPVFHLSTYDSEFVLVPRARLSEAMDCFSDRLPLDRLPSPPRVASAVDGEATQLVQTRPWPHSRSRPTPKPSRSSSSECAHAPCGAQRGSSRLSSHPAA